MFGTWPGGPVPVGEPAEGSSLGGTQSLLFSVSRAGSLLQVSLDLLSHSPGSEPKALGVGRDTARPSSYRLRTIVPENSLPLYFWKSEPGDLGTIAVTDQSAS